MVFESHASDIYLIVEEGFYKRTWDIHRTLGLLLHTQVSIQQVLKLPAECFHPKPKVNSVLIKLTQMCIRDRPYWEQPNIYKPVLIAGIGRETSA